MSHSVFISYARKTSEPAARALHAALGADVAFLDTQDLDVGTEFPRALTNAVLGARVFVALIDGTYFQRWYCLREWLLARAPFDEALRRGVSATGTSAAVDHTVVALGTGLDDGVLSHLPPALRNVNWPATHDIDRIAALVATTLAQNRESIFTRCEEAGVPLARTMALSEEAALPPAQNLAGIPKYPRDIPSSLGSDFVGRANDLWRLHVALTESRLGGMQVAAVTAALKGGGGFGKTQLAREYLHRFGPIHHSGGCFWIDASGSSLDRQFHGVLLALEPTTVSLEEMRDAGRDVRSVLSDALDQQAASHSILVVVDNVPEPGAAVPLPLSTWCPALGKVACLVTSRKRIHDFGAVESLDLDVLNLDSAVALLAGSSRPALHDAEWIQIAEWVGRLPLALTLLRAALDTGASPRLLLESTSSETTTSVLDAQMEALRGTVPDGALRGISEAFELSYALLPDDAKRLARHIAWFAPTPLPEELVAKLTHRVATLGARLALGDRSFLQRSHAIDGSAGSQMHRVLADFLRVQSTESPIELSEALAALNDVLDSLDLNGRYGRAVFVGLAPHVERFASWVDRERDEQFINKHVTVFAHLSRTAITLADFGDRVIESAPLDVAVKAFRAILRAGTREWAPMHWAKFQVNLGSALTKLGGREASPTRVREAVVAYRAALEVQDMRAQAPMDWAAAQNNLGSALSMLGEGEGADGPSTLSEALAAHRAALDVYTLEETPMLWAMTHDSIGSALATLSCRIFDTSQLSNEAVASFRAALKVRTREVAEMEWARTQHNLGSALFELGTREPGITLLSEALEAFRESLEVHTRDRMPLGWANSQSGRGLVLRTLGERRGDWGQISEAVAAFDGALEIYSRERTPLDWARTQSNLACALMALAELDPDITLLSDARLALREGLETVQARGLDYYRAALSSNLDLCEKMLRMREMAENPD